MIRSLNFEVRGIIAQRSRVVVIGSHHQRGTAPVLSAALLILHVPPVFELFQEMKCQTAVTPSVVPGRNDASESNLAS
jgi:hypothetical protein